MKYDWFFAAVILYIIICMPVGVQAQLNEKVFQSDHRINPDQTRELRIEFDNLNYFKDDELQGKFMEGYTLPGFWAQFKLTYQPLDNLKLEGGVHLLRFWGANKYPNFAYQDISTWKGSHFQKGFHALPWLRAQLKLSNQFDIVFGDLYGGANHRLIEPLYNPELNLMADPEAGLQLLHHSRWVDFDAWVNWESFIFNLDTHQEAFTVGLSTRFRYNSENAAVHFYSPLQVLAQHRGGEIDTLTTNSVQTLMNGAAGFGALWNVNRRVLKNINVEVDATGYYQQSGKLWPFDDGYGLYAQASANLSDFHIKAAYWQCKDFISMFGMPFYGAVSTSESGLTFKNPKMVTLGLEYTRQIGRESAFGVNIDVYHHFSSTSNGPEGPAPYKSATSFTFGAYLRLNTSFLVKRFE